MKLSVHLAKADVEDPIDILKDSYVSGVLEQIEQSEDLPYQVTAFVIRNNEKAPRWASFLAPAFDVRELRNQSNSFILLTKVKERGFALTFGYGHNAVDKARVEPMFGLKVCASCVSDTGLRQIDSRTVDVVSRVQRTALTAESRLAEFGVNVKSDWVRRLAGKPDPGVASKVAGADSLSITVDCELATIPQVLELVLELFQSDAYKTNFGFLDNYRPLPDGDPRIDELDDELRRHLADRNDGRITLALGDDVLTDEQVASYVFSVGGETVEEPELTLEALHRLLDAAGTDPAMDPLSRVKVWAVDESDNLASKRLALRDCLGFEVSRDEAAYVLSVGSWFEVSRDYLNEVRGRVAALDDITSSLALPPMRAGEKEGDYNARVAVASGWALLDARNVTLTGRQRVEACDLATPNQDMVCVKKMQRSATLSHLWAQGSVSARLYRQHEAYRTRVQELAGESAVQLGEAGDLRYVFAVATTKTGTIADSLFLFSQINLLEHVSAITMTGARVALCKIEYELPAISAGPPSTVAVKPTKRRRG